MIIPCGLPQGYLAKEVSEKPLVSRIQDTELIPRGLPRGGFIHLHPKKFLKAYLEACAENRGKPPDNIDNFLPWNLSEEQKSAWKYSKGHPLL